jgi:phage protein U
MQRGLIALSICGFVSQAEAQSCSNCGGMFVINSISRESSNCDANEKTPHETLQCKLDYWKKAVVDRQKDVDKATDSLRKAQERVDAFTRELR